jgi:hypothetical protein
MSRLLGVVFIYAAMILAWTGVGLFMLIAPVRFGNLVHDNLQLFPEVNRIGLLAFAVRLTVRIAHEVN